MPKDMIFGIGNGNKMNNKRKFDVALNVKR